MLYEKHGAIHFFRFDSVAETATEAARASKPYRGRAWDALTQLKTNWIGRSFASYEKVEEALSQYWQQGMEAYTRMIDKLRDQHFEAPQNLRRRATWSDDSGDELCLDRLRSAQPFWRTTRRDHRPGPMNVTIITDTATLSMVAHLDILWRGAAAVCLTELLEQSGYRVELWQAEHIGKAFAKTSGQFGCASLLKAPQDPLDVSTLINATSGWMERTIFFAVVSLVGQPDDGDGKPLTIDPLVPFITPDDQTIISKDIWTEAAAVNWVQQQLEKFKTGEFAQR